MGIVDVECSWRGGHRGQRAEGRAAEGLAAAGLQDAIGRGWEMRPQEIAIVAVLALMAGCSASDELAVAAPTDDIDTVTLQQAMSSRQDFRRRPVRAQRRRAAPGIPPFDPDLPADVWEAVRADVAQHVLWHTDPQFTSHALPGGRERITRGTSLDDPVVYEDPR